MPEITLTAEVGRKTGSRDAARLRTTGRIPGVLYGHGRDPLPVAVDAKELRHALNTDAGLNALLNLQLSDGGRQLVITKEIQRHPVRNTVVHIDFIAVNVDEVLSTDVPVHLVGDAEKVRRQDGSLDHQLTSVTITAKANAVPTSIDVDVTQLSVGDVVRIGDLVLPEGVTADGDPDTAVVVVSGPSIDVIETEAADAETEAREDADDSVAAAGDATEEAEKARAVAEGETPEGSSAPSEA